MSALKESRQAADDKTVEKEVWQVDLGMRRGEYQERLKAIYWGWRNVQSELMRDLPDDDQGQAHGRYLAITQKQVLSLEEDLKLLDQHRVEALYKLCAMQAEDAREETSPTLVPRTYTVPLAKLREELEDWARAMREECRQLKEATGAVRAIHKDDLAKLEGFKDMEMAQGKLVTTIKAPFGRKGARVVICGNMVQGMKEDRTQSKLDRYAGGIDGTVLRYLFRNSAEESWTLAATDVKTAFLLAPKRETNLMVVVPPRALVDAGVIPATERWIVQKAMYGLPTSPADWGAYRDGRLAKLRWELNGKSMKLRATHEPNLWQVVSVPADEKIEGYTAVYVDDILGAGPQDLATSLMARLTEEWGQ